MVLPSCYVFIMIMAQRTIFSLISDPLFMILSNTLAFCTEIAMRLTVTGRQNFMDKYLFRVSKKELTARDQSVSMRMQYGHMELLTQM